MATTARCSGERSTTKRHACALAPDGAQVAASRQRVTVASSTGSSVKRRIVRAVDMTSQTSLLGAAMRAFLLVAVRRRSYAGGNGQALRNPVWLRTSGSAAIVASPGAASHTAGTALRTCIALATFAERTCSSMLAGRVKLADEKKSVRIDGSPSIVNVQPSFGRGQ